MRVEREIGLDAPPEAVYELVMDPGRLGDWVTIHAGLKEAPPELSEGAELVQRLRVAGQRFTVHWTVTEADPASRVVWEGRGPAGSVAKVAYEFERDGERTRFRYVNEYELPGGPVGRIAGRAVSRATAREVDRTLARLKALVERGVAAARSAPPG